MPSRRSSASMSPRLVHAAASRTMRSFSAAVKDRRWPGFGTVSTETPLRCGGAPWAAGGGRMGRSARGGTASRKTPLGRAAAPRGAGAGIEAELTDRRWEGLGTVAGPFSALATQISRRSLSHATLAQGVPRRSQRKEPRHQRSPERQQARPHRLLGRLRRPVSVLLDRIERRLHCVLDFLPLLRDTRHRGRFSVGGGCLANAIIHSRSAPVYPSSATSSGFPPILCVRTGNYTLETPLFIAWCKSISTLFWSMRPPPTSVACHGMSSAPFAPTSIAVSLPTGS